MKAVVIGANWGLVHVYALRAAGVEVIALGGRCAQELQPLAAEHGIPCVVDSYAAVRALAPDLVSLATPAAVHLQGLQALRDLPVICEKPLLGQQGEAQALLTLGDRLWVNYAFAFLPAAQTLLALRGRLGRLHRVEMQCDYALPQSFTPQQGWFEIGTHPLSFLTLLCGEPRWERQSRREGETLHCSLGGVPAVLRCQQRAQPQGTQQQGIAQRLALYCEAGLVELSGAFRLGQPWQYDALRLNGQALCAATPPGQDAWIQANQSSLATMVRQFAGELTPLQAVQAGVFPACRAWPIDQLLIAAWQA